MNIASSWFRRLDVSETLTRIDEPHTDLLVMANIWHLRGRDRDLIVDTGLGVAPLREHLPELFERDPAVVLTHTHFDHTGGAYEFRDCCAHPAGSFERPGPASLNGPAALASVGLAVDDVDFPVADSLLDALPHAGYDPGGYRLRPATIGRWLGDGDVIDLGDRRLTVLHLPGHTPESIALFDEHDGTLFSGDVLYDGELLDTCTGADISRYADSLRRLRELPVSVVHAGHCDSFGRDHMRHLIDRYLRSAHVAARAEGAS